jgi:hypothetical protein
VDAGLSSRKNPQGFMSTIQEWFADELSVLSAFLAVAESAVLIRSAVGERRQAF